METPLQKPSLTQVHTQPVQLLCCQQVDQEAQLTIVYNVDDLNLSHISGQVMDNEVR
jgi:hypothetical protein